MSKKNYLPIPNSVGHIKRKSNVTSNTKHNRKAKSTNLIKADILGVPQMRKSYVKPNTKKAKSTNLIKADILDVPQMRKTYVKPNIKHNHKKKSTQVIKVSMLGAPPLTKEERTPRPKLPFED